MGGEVSLDDEGMGVKLQLDALLAEYDVVADRVARFRQMQGQLDSLALTGLGLSVPLVLVILERSRDSVGAILLVPILFFAIAFTQLRHERQIQLDSVYLDWKLRPKVNKLLSQVSGDEVSVFEFEDFLSEHYFPPSVVVQWVVTTSRGGISLGVGVGLIAICVYLQLVVLGLDWSTYETWLLLIALLILAGDLTLGYYVAGMHYRFYRMKREGEKRGG
jgi:hypothetical protein